MYSKLDIHMHQIKCYTHNFDIILVDIDQFNIFQLSIDNNWKFYNSYPIPYMSREVGNLSSLYSLTLRCFNINQSNLTNLINIELLNLPNNNLHEIPKLVTASKKLYFANFQYNKISCITEIPSTLIAIVLSNNHITIYPTKIGDMIEDKKRLNNGIYLNDQILSTISEKTKNYFLKELYINIIQ